MRVPTTCSGMNPVSCFRVPCRAFSSARGQRITRRLWTTHDLLAQYLLDSDDSTIKLSVSVALGVFTGILPIWGFQTIAAMALAFCLRLNKLVLVAASSITQPPFTPVIVYGSFVLGRARSAQGTLAAAPQQDLIGSIVRALLSAPLSGAVVYLLVRWRRQRSMAP